MFGYILQHKLCATIALTYGEDENICIYDSWLSCNVKSYLHSSGGISAAYSSIWSNGSELVCSPDCGVLWLWCFGYSSPPAHADSQVFSDCWYMTCIRLSSYSGSRSNTLNLFLVAGVDTSTFALDCVSFQAQVLTELYPSWRSYSFSFSICLWLYVAYESYFLCCIWIILL